MRPAEGTADVTARLEVAEQVASQFGAEATVSSVTCGGSTGRRHADEWSDLEIGVVWTRPPDEEIRRRIAANLGGQDVRLFEFDVSARSWFDEWWIGGPAGRGLLVEIVHHTESDLRRHLDRLLVDHEPEPSLLTLAAAFDYGQPLRGSVEELTTRLAGYPRPLAVNVVRRLGQLDHFWRWEMYVARRDPHGLRKHFAVVADAVTQMVCALNGRWWPGPKWPSWALSGLMVSPPDLWPRLTSVDDLRPAAAAAALTDLVEEAYDLVERHLPEADPHRLRAIFRFARHPWPVR